MRTLQDLSRRDLLRLSALGAFGTVGGWRRTLADEIAVARTERRHVVLLWMTGGPSQIDTFDMKPGHENGGEYAEVDTAAPGVRFSEHLPELAKQADRLAILRSLSTKEGDHGRGTYLARTGHQPGGVVRYPTMGSLFSRALGDEAAEMPNYVSIAPYRVFNRAAFGPGFLGPRYAPLTVAAADNFQQLQNVSAEDYAELGVDDLAPAGNVTPERATSRVELLRSLQDDFVPRHPSAPVAAHATVSERALRLMKCEAARAFDLEEEPAAVREAYGKGRFGQGCLMTRRLIERGVPFVEVSLGRFGGGALGWDTHRGNFQIVKDLSLQLDAAWSTLMTELAERGLLDRTTILWIGEFGRTPKINRGGGRDHYPKAWSCVLAGGGVSGGRVYGRTSDDGTEVVDGRVEVADVLSTLFLAAGVDPSGQNVSGMGRPIRLSEGEPIREVLA